MKNIRARSASRVLPEHFSSQITCWFCWFVFFCTCLQQVHAAGAVNPSSKSVQLALSTEPPDLNSLTTTDSVSFFVLLHTQEGLLSYGEADALVGGVAEAWHMNGTHVEFTLRDNARWCDGSPVTAQDFIFAWRTALKPATASRYAFILYPIRNAEKINRGELPETALGVSADDDRHLRIELERPTAYFPSLTTFPTYLPVKESFYQAQQGKYGADAERLLCNGPFRLEKWVHGASLRLQRNPGYWNASRVRLQQIDIPHISNDPGTLFNLFQAGDIALAELSRDTLRQALHQRLYLQDFGNGMLTYIEFNQRSSRSFRSENLRRAISLSVDRNELVNRVIASPGTQTAARFFPQWLLPSTSITDRYQGADLQAARQAVAMAKMELGTPVLPPLTLLVYDSPAVLRQAEYLQQQWQSQLGLTVIIDKQIFKQKLAKLAAGDFDLALSAWGPDYNDAMTFADLLASDNENNHGRYHSDAYDTLLRQASALPAGPQRTALFEQMQQLIDEDVAVMPLTEPGIIYVQDTRLRNVQRRRFGGDPDLRFADIAVSADIPTMDSAK